MGIRNLTRFINVNSKNGIQKMVLLKLKGKTIVIDTSIYLYKFASNDSLIEDMYSLCSLLLFYKITPIFIFDGFTPKEKKVEIKLREEKKRIAKIKFLFFEKILTRYPKEKIYIKKKMNILRRQFTTVSKSDRNSVKELLKNMGISYYQAAAEADSLCAQLVLNGTAWGCLSDDSDLFVYGCPNILTNLNLQNHTILLYNMKNILNDLNMTLQLFQSMCVLSGTDYKHQSKGDIFYHYKQFCSQKQLSINNDYSNVLKIYQNSNISKDNLYFSSSFDKQTLQTFLKKYNFVFP